jgi:hypothetical protein
MTAKELLEGKTLNSVEKADSLIINLIVDDLLYGLDVDTSTLESGTSLTNTTSFTIKGDILTVGKSKLDLSTTNILVAEISGGTVVEDAE